jgi:Cu(I)/Ag(I) efflux system protein CusF
MTHQSTYQVMSKRKENNMKFLAKVVILGALTLPSISMVHAEVTQSTASSSDAMSTGEVKKVDKSAGKLTIKHGPLTNLGMGAMTMVFRVKDPVMLDEVKAGDKINFVAEKPNGQLTVTQLEKQK